MDSWNTMHSSDGQWELVVSSGNVGIIADSEAPVLRSLLFHGGFLFILIMPENGSFGKRLKNKEIFPNFAGRKWEKTTKR